MPKKKKRKSVDKLTKKDYNALFSIYRYRILSREQIFELNYKYKENGSISSGRWFENIFGYFVNERYIKKIPMFGKIPDVYALDQKGVNTLKEHFGWAKNVYSSTEYKIMRNYLTSKELIVAETFIPHQYHLNEFIIGLTRIIEKDLGDYDYKDEKRIDLYKIIRPDGILSVPSQDFFIELDMSTESKTRLSKKWESYTKFLFSDEFLYRERDITMIFAITGIKEVKNRVSLVRKTMGTLFAAKNRNGFNSYVLTTEKAKKLFRNKLYPLSQGDESNTKKWIKNILKNLLKNGFILNEEHLKNNKYILEKGNLIFHITDGTYSSLRAISDMYIFGNKLETADGKRHKMLYILEDEFDLKDIQNIILEFDINRKDIVFVSSDRLVDKTPYFTFLAGTKGPRSFRTLGFVDYDFVKVKDIKILERKNRLFVGSKGDK